MQNQTAPNLPLHNLKSTALSYDIGIIIFHYGSVHSFCFANGRQRDRRVLEMQSAYLFYSDAL